MPSLEYKALPADFVASTTDEGEYEGYFSTTAVEDDGGDTIMPGAFKKTLAEAGSRVLLLFGHHPDRILSRPKTLSEDTKGLHVAGRLAISRGGQKGGFWADECWALLKEGILTEGSIGYFTIPARTDLKSDGGRTLHELKLQEVSLVPWGMNPHTSISAVKSLYGAGALSFDTALDALETFAAVIGEGKAGRALSAANVDRIRAAHTHVGAAMEHLQSMLDAAAPLGGAVGPDAALEEGDDTTHTPKAQHPAPLLLRARLLELSQHFPTLNTR